MKKKLTRVFCDPNSEPYAFQERNPFIWIVHFTYDFEHTLCGAITKPEYIPSKSDMGVPHVVCQECLKKFISGGSDVEDL